MIHTVIFDVGGTLIGAPDMFDELTKLFPGSNTRSKLQKTLMSEYLAIGKGQRSFITIEQIIKNTLKAVSMEVGCPDISAKAKDVYYNTFVTKSYLYDDTLIILNYLKSKNVNILIASDGDAKLLYDQFKMHKLDTYFSKIFISSELKAYKPNNLFVDALKSEIHGAYNKVMFVGDSDVDILTGQKLGVKTVLIGSKDGKESAPEYTVSSLKELIPLIEKTIIT